MANTELLKSVSESGWRSGFTTLLRRDLRVWWGTRYGLVQLVMWPVILNGLMAIIITTAGENGENNAYFAVESFMGISFWFTNIGILIIAQNAIIGEKLSGTATWILSGPVSRGAFIWSKLIPIAIGSLITMIVLPGVIAYYQFSLMPADGTTLEFVPFLTGQGIMALQLMFFLSLTFLTGTLFSSRGLVITVPIVVWFGGLIPLNILPSWLVNLTPWPITPTATALARGETPDSLIPLISTAIWIVVFMAVALWRFRREEF